MSKLTIAIIAATGVGLVLGWLLDPAITLLVGIALWFCILLLLGGAEDPNPARTSILLHRGIPDRPLVHRAMKPVKVQKEKNIRGKYIWLLLISGALLVGTGICWMYGAGMW